VLAGTQRRRSTEPGTHLQLLVLTSTSDGCIAVDTASGALVRASYHVPDGVEMEPQPAVFDLVQASIGPADDEALEPSLPEAVQLTGPPHRVGHLSKRKAERLLRPLVHPPREPLLGIPGPAVAFWELRGNRPSVALVEPERPPAVVRRGPGSGLRCRFQWRGSGQELPLLAPPVTPARRLLVALTPPVDGRCYKVVAGLLP
jgi:hypothetical protein